MENSIEVQAGNKMQSLTRETTRVNALSRLTYIDMIRFVLMMLVIMVHAAVTYGAEGDWTYRDLGANDMLTQVLIVASGDYLPVIFHGSVLLLRWILNTWDI